MPAYTIGGFVLEAKDVGEIVMQFDRRTFVQSTAASGLLAALPQLAVSALPPEPGQVKPKPIRVGQIGTAHSHASGKFTALRELPEHFEIVGLVEPDETRRAGLDKAAVYRDVPRMTEAELFKVPNLQAVVVETSVRDLVATGQRVVDAGFHLHLEKPAGESLPAFEKLLKTAEQKKLALQLGYMFRNNPGFGLARCLLLNKALGEIFEIEASFGKMVGEKERRELNEFRGGGMFELGCHVIDAVTILMGQPQRVTAFNRSSGAPPADLQDNQMAILEYPKAIAVIKAAVIDPQGGPRRELVIHGSNGTLELQPIEANKPKLTLVKGMFEWPAGVSNPPVERYDWPADVSNPQVKKSRGRYVAQIQHWAEMIRGENRWPSYEHDLNTHRVVLQASGYDVK
jgi:predicted dehydrogenase